MDVKVYSSSLIALAIFSGPAKYARDGRVEKIPVIGKCDAKTILELLVTNKVCVSQEMNSSRRII